MEKVKLVIQLGPSAKCVHIQLEAYGFFPDFLNREGCNFKIEDAQALDEIIKSTECLLYYGLISERFAKNTLNRGLAELCEKLYEMNRINPAYTEHVPGGFVIIYE